MLNCNTVEPGIQPAGARAREEHEPGKEPPADNMGVKNTGEPLNPGTLPVLFHCDYLRVTAWIDKPEWENVYDLTLGGDLGDWIDLEHGGRFYKNVYQSRLGARLYANPGGAGCDERQITVELPGKVCQFLGWDKLQNFYLQLKLHSWRFSVTRIDLAFDHAPFTVAQFWEAVNGEGIRTYARRDSFRLWEAPGEKRENGEKGCSTAYIGTRDSLRMLRVYDKHGFTRVELECHDEKASQVAVHLFETGDGDESPLEAVSRRAMGNLRDFIDVESSWWKTFTAGIVRAYQVLTGKTATEVSVDEVSSWLYKQASAALSVVLDVYGDDFIRILVRGGREKRKRNKRYQIILQDRC